MTTRTAPANRETLERPCERCAQFALAISGLRGPQWFQDQEAGRRHLWVTPNQGYRGGCAVGPAFVRDVVARFHGWLEHLTGEKEAWCLDLEEAETHVSQSVREPVRSWLFKALEAVDWNREPKREAAVTFTAALLGVSPATVWRKLH